MIKLSTYHRLNRSYKRRATRSNARLAAGTRDRRLTLRALRAKYLRLPDTWVNRLRYWWEARQLTR